MGVMEKEPRPVSQAVFGSSLKFQCGNPFQDKELFMQMKCFCLFGVGNRNDDNQLRYFLVCS